MQRYALGQIRPEWRSAAPERPILKHASDRLGFGVLAEGELGLYRLAHGVLGGSTTVDALATVQLGKSTVFALAPSCGSLALATGSKVEISSPGQSADAAVKVDSGAVVALCYSASGKTLWAVADGPKPTIYAWDTATLEPVGKVEVLAMDGSSFDLVVSPESDTERVGVDAAAGQDGSSFTFVERTAEGIELLPGSHDSEDGVALGGLLAQGALLISREDAVVVDVNSEDVLAGPADATLDWAKGEMVFDYQRGYIDGFWVLSGSFDNRDEDDETERAPVDVPEGRLRVFDADLKEVLEMPSTDNEYETPWAVVGLAQRRVLICQAEEVLLYNLQPYLTP